MSARVAGHLLTSPFASPFAEPAELAEAEPS